jgi:hypothetical protein
LEIPSAFEYKRGKHQNCDGWGKNKEDKRENSDYFHINYHPEKILHIKSLSYVSGAKKFVWCGGALAKRLQNKNSSAQQGCQGKAVFKSLQDLARATTAFFCV